jgi:hypothetical protein
MTSGLPPAEDDKASSTDDEADSQPEPNQMTAPKEPDPQLEDKQSKPEPVPHLVMPDKESRTKLFHEIDVNGNGGLSLAEIDKAVVSGQIGQAMHCPDFNHKPALMRAYKAADTDGDAFIERREFFKLLKYARLDFAPCPVLAAVAYVPYESLARTARASVDVLR